MYKRNAGESAKPKFRLSIPPKLRFDVLKKEDKTHSVALANVRPKPKSFGSEIPHYVYTRPLATIRKKRTANLIQPSAFQDIRKRL